ncbi:hypothetical protein G5B37_10180 [Rasiella rasia]|uniref:Uncharacterized protein n=1 Tax=Rasiella rasia TaxID=2744027 RepID=A0A6G6GN00_9FLAO|nr:hypothetical protein [Rasiella rasia]QIE59918.1 hypothetical protein G5B37_10180 [Rasiella rasia]
MKNKVLLIIILFPFYFGNAQELVWDINEQFTSENLLKKGAVSVITINTTIEVQGSVSVPSSISLKFVDKGMLKIADEQTSLVIHGSIEAKRQQIFDISSPGVTSYRFESVSNIKMTKNKQYFPEWWGVFPNVVPSKNGNKLPKASHHQFLKEIMLDIAASGGGELIFDEGVYYIRDLIIDFDNIEVRGQGAKKTILRFDSENYGYSTRRGTVVMIQGPTLEKFYSKMVPDGIPIAGNFSFTEKQQTIENIIMRDLTVEWDAEAARADPSMNGIAVMNAKNVLIEGVHIDLHGANRAFFLGNAFEGDVTENVTIANSSCVNSRTGVFILSGYAKDENPRKKMVLNNINILNNHLQMVPMQDVDVKNEHLVLRYLDEYASGVFFIGNEYTTSFTHTDGTFIEREMGTFLIEGNIIENADFGIRSWYGNADEHKGYVHDVTIKDNYFRNFRLIGAMAPFKTSQIVGNVFIVDTFTPIPASVEDDRGEDYKASAIFAAKAPFGKYKSDHGPEKVQIENNIIQGCFLRTSPIVVRPKEKANITIHNNQVVYSNDCKVPKYDIVITTDIYNYGTQEATVNIKNNSRGSAIQPIEEATLHIDARRKKHITLLDTQ